MDFQALIDGMSAQMMRERAESQMTLGALIERLESLPESTLIGLAEPHSYRGYYSDLAFEQAGTRPVADLLAECREAMGKKFEGYKGGDFYMHAGTPVWVAFYGCCGDKLMLVNDDGSLGTQADD